MCDKTSKRLLPHTSHAPPSPLRHAPRTTAHHAYDDGSDQPTTGKGVAGYSETQERLEQVSEKTSTLNDAKGKTLEEISRIVTDINHKLKEKKNKLAPQIKELSKQTTRSAYSPPPHRALCCCVSSQTEGAPRL